jgi:hypothetical protein
VSMSSSDHAHFGCTDCFQGDPASCWATRSDHVSVADLADEPHFIVRVVACRRCGQRFASIFCERIDWISGEDPQYGLLVPLRAAEAQELKSRGLDLALLQAFGNGRPRLVMVWPADADKAVRRLEGGPLIIPPHD